MTSTLEHAARVDDRITHASHENAEWEGILIGAGIGILVTLFTGGAGLIIGATICSFASTGGDLAVLLSRATGGGKMVPAGKIVDGAETVFTGRFSQRAAKAHPETRVDCHGDHFVCQGSKTTFIEGVYASRRKDKTSCGGAIMEGCPNVYIGGPATNLPGMPDPKDQGYRSKLMAWTRFFLDVGSLLKFPTRASIRVMAKDRAVWEYVGDVYSKLGKQIGLPLADQMGAPVKWSKAWKAPPKDFSTLKGAGSAIDDYRKKAAAAADALKRSTT